MRVVLDTNILISAFIFPGGSTESVYRLALLGELDLIITRPLLAEFGRVLEGKFGWEPAKAEEAIRQLARIASVVEPSEQLSEIPEDPADNRVLEAALEGAAKFIVSGDRHLLNRGSFRGIQIVTATSFLDRRG